MYGHPRDVLKGTNMKLGVVVYSLSGNTLSVAEIIKTNLVSKGHAVIVESIKAKNEDPKATGPVELTQAPAVGGLEALVLGGPVRGFAVAPIVKAYLEQLPELNGLPVFLFVTHHFPFAFLGGNSTIGMMRKLIESKGGKIIGTGVVNWSSKQRNDDIRSVTDKVVHAMDGLQ
jgi:hypothetical protein